MNIVSVAEGLRRAQDGRDSDSDTEGGITAVAEGPSKGESTDLGSVETVVPSRKRRASSKRKSVESDKENLGKGRGSSKRKSDTADRVESDIADSVDSDTADSMETSEPEGKRRGSRNNSLESRNSSVESDMRNRMEMGPPPTGTKASGSKHTRRRTLESEGSMKTDRVDGSSKRKSWSGAQSSAQKAKLSGNEPAVSGTHVFD